MIVHLLPGAIGDIESIADCLGRDNPVLAMTIIRELQEKCMSLANMPLAFPLVSRCGHYDIRHRVHGNDQIFYRVVHADERIDIVHVLHGSRNYAEILYL